jgi:copper resistance protein C
MRLQVRRLRCRRTVWVPGSVSLLLVLLLVNPGSALAHTSVLAGSTPSSGEVVGQVAEIELRFSTTIRPEFAVFALTGDDGSVMDLEEPRFDAAHETVRVTPMARLPDGGYRLAYQIVTSDNHPASGLVAFGVGDPAAQAPATGSPSRGPSPPTSQATRSPDAQPAGLARIDPIVWGMLAGLVVLGAAGAVYRMVTRRGSRSS